MARNRWTAGVQSELQSGMASQKSLLLDIHQSIFHAKLHSVCIHNGVALLYTSNGH